MKHDRVESIEIVESMVRNATALFGTKRRSFCNVICRQEVNQSLVDDGLVDLDKIGSANFFWSFPSKMAVAKQNTVDSLKRDIAKVKPNWRLKDVV